MPDPEAGPQHLQKSSPVPPGRKPPPGPPAEKPRCVSLTAGLNRLLNTGLHLPMRSRPWDRKQRSVSDTSLLAGPQGAAEAHEGPQCFGPSDDILMPGSDLDQENAHFVVVDMILEAIEEAKWVVRGRRGPRLAARRGLLPLSALRDEPKSSTQPSRPRTQHSDGNPGLQLMPRDVAPVSFHGEQPDSEKNDPGSGSDKVSAEGDVPSSVPSSPQVPTRPCSAEALAQMLMSAFRKQWLPTQALWCSPGNLSPALQEFLPSSDATTAAQSLAFTEEIRQKSRMRGTLMWAPPRFQMILNIHPPKKRSEVMASQQYLCAGCGTEVEVKYTKKLRYCEYLGRYFCECCHSQAEAVIPGRVLQCWDFGLYPVCNFSKRLLDSMWFLPLFGLCGISRTLYPKARELDKLRELLEQLVAIKKQLGACRLAEGILQEFQQLPGHLTQDPPLLSLDDLLAVKRGLLVPQARTLRQAAAAHVDGCELCLANGFICEFCHSQDVIFPFQSERCKRCTECKACFHTDCFRDVACPKCARMENRKKLMGTSAVLGV